MQITSVTEYEPTLKGITLELTEEQAFYVLYCLGVNTQPNDLYERGGSHLYIDLFDHLKTALGLTDDETYNLSTLAADKKGETIGESSMEALFN